MSKLRNIFAGALVAVAPFAAQAATITIMDLSGGDADVVIADTGVLTGAGVAGSFSSGMTFNVTVTPLESPGQSLLNTVSVTTSGAGKIGILVSEDDFNEGGGTQDSNLRFSLSATSVGYELTGIGYVDAGNGIGSMSDVVGAGTIAFSTPFTAGFESDVEYDTAALPGLFSMTSYFTVEHDSARDITSFDATQIAAVPLPAAGFLLFGALGGLAAMRRRRKAA